MDEDEDDYIIYDDDLTEGKEVVRRLRSEIPEKHQRNADTRVQWLWMQRLVIVQNIKLNGRDVQDVMAASLVLQATMLEYLPSIELVLQRLEGGAITDAAVVEQTSMPL